MKRSTYRLRYLVALQIIALCAALLPSTGGVRAQAPAAVAPVRYDAGLGTIFVGEKSESRGQSFTAKRTQNANHHPADRGRGRVRISTPPRPTRMATRRH